MSTQPPQKPFVVKSLCPILLVATFEAYKAPVKVFVPRDVGPGFTSCQPTPDDFYYVYNTKQINKCCDLGTIKRITN